MNLNTSITPFLFRDATVRTVTRNAVPWFVAADVCAILGLGNISQTINGNEGAGAKGLEEDEKGIYNLDTRSLNGIEQTREVLIINEPGLYRLIFKSRKAEARVFQRWVFHEVLPAIRRTGCYGSHHQAFLNLIRDQIDLGVSPDVAARAALSMAPSRREIAEMMPALNPLLEETDEMLSRMEYDIPYTIPDLANLLPRTHPIIKKKSVPSQRSAIGKLMERARLHGKAEKSLQDGTRNITYTRRQTIIPFATAEN